MALTVKDRSHSIAARITSQSTRVRGYATVHNPIRYGSPAIQATRFDPQTMVLDPPHFKKVLAIPRSVRDQRDGQGARDDVNQRHGLLISCLLDGEAYEPSESPPRAVGTIPVALARFLAEREGFEPSEPRKGFNGFRDRPVQPLRHLSAGVFTGFTASPQMSCDVWCDG